MEGYLQAIREADFEKASRYLDLSNIPSPQKSSAAPKRARELIQLLDRNGYIYDINEMSSSPEGNTRDGLDLNLDQVGVLDRVRREIPLLVHRVDGDQENQKIWLFEPSMLGRVPFYLLTSEESLLDRILPDQLKSEKFGQVSIGHWLAIILSLGVALLIGWLISWSLIWLLKRMLHQRSDIAERRALSGIVIPLGVVIGVSLYRLAVVQLGVQLIARDYVNWVATIASLAALAWLGLRIADGVFEVIRYGLNRTRRLTSVAVFMLVKRIIKAAILGVVAITILDIFGFDVSTGLAALGIGGIALALGAQKTIENLVGSITVVIDKPVSVGDFCKFGEVMGTVEDIGIRSTQVRTLDRTVVTVPNGAFASMQIENYSRRDQFRFQTVLTMRYETTSAQLRYLLAELRKLLHNHEKITESPARVRFVNLGSHSKDIEIFAYVLAPDFHAFLEIQEQLLLDIVDIVAESGADFAFPSQTLYMGRDHVPSPERAHEIEGLVESLQKEGD